jgi:dihydrofolate reductase
MRKIILMMSVSLDGFFEGPDREIGWHRVDDELHAHFNEVAGSMSAFLEGRVTYELMESHWPAADADPDAPAPVAGFARIWRRMPKIVYSRTLAKAGPNAVISREVVREQILELKARPGGDMALGGAQLAASFMREGLVDEYRIYVHPVVLGRGRPLFAPLDARLDLRLVESRTFGAGVVLLRYR